MERPHSQDKLDMCVFQAHRSQQQVDCVQAENQRLQLHLEDAQRHCRQMEDTAQSLTEVSVFATNHTHRCEP